MTSHIYPGDMFVSKTNVIFVLSVTEMTMGLYKGMIKIRYIVNFLDHGPSFDNYSNVEDYETHGWPEGIFVDYDRVVER